MSLTRPVARTIFSYITLVKIDIWKLRVFPPKVFQDELKFARRGDMSNLPRFVAVTGAQGVGKSTFCQRLANALREKCTERVLLLDGLGDRLAAKGVRLGSAAERDTIAAVFAEHLERELAADAEIVVLDRCVIDALAYTMSLGVSTDAELRLYEKVTRLAASKLRIVIHLQLSEFFTSHGKPHETSQLRTAVAEQLSQIISMVNCENLSIDASDDTAVAKATEKVISALAM